jgi:hypothetical protein
MPAIVQQRIRGRNTFLRSPLIQRGKTQHDRIIFAYTPTNRLTGQTGCWNNPIVMSLNRTRSTLYTAARALGWLNAALRGRLLQRILRVLLLRKAGSLINRSIP